MTRLSGKVAFLTGGGSGIGRACALLFAQEGAKVAIAGRRREPLDVVVKEIVTKGGEALAVPCDVTRAVEVEQGIGAAVARFGRLDVVVNSAGALLVASADQTSEEQWRHLMDANLTGTFLVSRAALPALRKAGGGSIINIGSILGLIAMKDRVAYCAAKAGVTGLTKAMALDHAQDHIRVNCICPSIVETEMVASLFTRAPDPAAARRAREAQIPLGRMGKPEDVAGLALFLASDESGWMTGAAIPLDGGLSAY